VTAIGLLVFFIGFLVHMVPLNILGVLIVLFGAMRWAFEPAG
jgi:hypothetical protein